MECSGAANLWPRPTGPVSFSGDFVNFLPRDVSFAVDNRTPPETKVVCTYRTLKLYLFFARLVQLSKTRI